MDLIIVYASWCLAYFLRFESGLWEKSSVSQTFYFGFGLLLAIVSSITFKNSKLYDALRLENQTKELMAQFKASLVSFFVFLIIAFFVSEHRLSRIMLVLYFGISLGGLFVSKIYFRRMFSKRKMRLMLVGAGEAAKQFNDKIQKLSNVEIVSWVDGPGSAEADHNLDLYEVEKAKLDGLVVGYPSTESDKLTTLLSKVTDTIVPVVYLPDVSFAKIGYSIMEFKGQPLIYMNEPKIRTSSLMLKRLFDFSATFVGMLLISPLLILISLLVKLTSKGPIFYGQVRMGTDGREFKMWKFRSMVVGEANKETWTVENDPRVTKIGRILRKTNLDELPQLWNILVGDMSLVGPRPERPQYVEKFRKEIPGYMIRHRFKAGLTGWAQVQGWRGDTSIERRIECDLWYIRNWSFALDIAIIFMTFFKGNKNAY